MRAPIVLAACLLAVMASAARPPLDSASGECNPLPRGAVSGSAVKGDDGWRFESGVVDGAAASAAYLDAAHTPSFFGKLRVVTSPAHPDSDQAFAAGFLEGYLTAERIADHYHNLHTYFITGMNVSLDRPMEWVHKQDAWVRSQAAAARQEAGGGKRAGGGGEEGDGVAYWLAVGLMLEQWDGLVAGYQARRRAELVRGPEGAAARVDHLTRKDLLFLHTNGDLYDIIDKDYADEALARGQARMPRSARAGNRHFARMTKGELEQAVALSGKCSALVKVKEDLSEIFFGHSTWDHYSAMLRIFKHYELNFQGVPGVASRKLSFSSYPGELFSDDDLYMTEAGLVVLETTNHIYNTRVFQALTPRSVLSWQRVRAANLLASSGEEWVALFKHHNSGTYNNQYMVADLNKFTPGKFLAPGLFHVVEQLPGIVEHADMTDTLARGYWPSYNVAYFPRIYNMSGYPSIDDVSGGGDDVSGGRGPVGRADKPLDEPPEWLKYQTSPRAKLFRRDQSHAVDAASFKRLMRFNDWRRDPLSGGAPFAAICGRGDLAPEGAAFGPILKGCYDSKVTTASMARRLQAEVVNGPTTQGQPPFEWAGRWANIEHRGMPQKFDFDFELQSPADLPLEPGCGGGAGAAGAAGAGARATPAAAAAAAAAAPAWRRWAATAGRFVARWQE